jgi:hypothetical protein
MTSHRLNQAKAKAARRRQDSAIYRMGRISNENRRVGRVIHDTPTILHSLDEQFAKYTELNEIDIKVLFLAVGLQIARQYLITNFPTERLDDQEAAENTPFHHPEHSDRHHRYYNPSVDQIWNNPVPFDANNGANGALSGGGRLGHRATAIGHDPVLGLIFGTANIATSTLTNYKFLSYHITTSNKRDYFKYNASTSKVLKYTLDKLTDEGNEGKKKVGLSLFKELIHLWSDVDTKNSLPLPFISAFNPEIASALASYGLDMANIKNVCKQASYAEIINTVIAMIHGLYDDSVISMDKKLYEVKTRKILSCSDLIASTSNLAVVGVTENLNLLDLGGLGVTILRLITDNDFISKVKGEFILGNYLDMLKIDI